MIQQALLKRNIFSLKLSQQGPHESGELLFGDINTDLYIGELVSLPVSTT
jgi:hypothetical protein